MLDLARPARRGRLPPLLLAGLALGCGPAGPERIRLASDAASASGDVASAASVLRVSPAELHTMAILHFENATADPGLEWLRRGISDMLVADLGQSPFLNVLNPARLEALLASGGKRAQDLPEDDTAARIARAAHVETLLKGRYFLDMGQLVIDAELRDVGTGRLLRHQAVRGAGLEDVFRMVGDLSRRVRENLPGDLKVARGHSLQVSEMTGSLEAFRHYSRGLENMERVLHSEAAQDFARAIEIDPEFAAAYLRLGQSRASLADHDAAIEAFATGRRLGHRLSPTDRLLLDLAEAQYEGDVARIRRIRDELWQQAPQDLQARLQVASLLMHMQETDRAMEELELIIEQDPAYKLAHNQLAYLYAARGDLSTALKHLERYRELSSDEPNAYDSSGEILMMAGRFDEATSYFERALAQHPEFFHSARHLTEIHAEQGRLDEALRSADRWLKAAPSPKHQAESWIARGRILWRFGREEAAREAFERARELNPDDARPDYLEAQLLVSEQQDAEASRVRDQGFELHARRLQARHRDPEIGAFVAMSADARIPPARLLSFVDAVAPKVRHQSLRDELALCRGLLLLRQAGKERAISPFAEQGRALETLMAAHQFQRSGTWKYLVEAVELEARTEPPTRPLHDRIAAAARELKRPDLDALSELLAAQYHAKYGRTRELEESYAALGVPREALWRVVGPFRQDAGFHRALAPELPRDHGARYRDAGRELAWRGGEDGVADGYLDLRQLFGDAPWSVAYAAIRIAASERRVVQLRVGADEAFKLWLNDELVWQRFGKTDASLDNDIVKVVLHEGSNDLRLKVSGQLRDWGFYLRVTDELGQGIPGLRFETPGPVEAARSGSRAAPSAS